MKVRGLVWLVLTTVAGILSAGVTFYGMYSAYAIDLRQDTVVTSLDCILPFLSFPVFVLVRPPRRSAILLAILAVAYLVVYSMLDWRTCSALGYCGGVASTVLETLLTRPVLAYFGAAILSFAALLVDNRTVAKRAQQ